MKDGKSKIAIFVLWLFYLTLTGCGKADPVLVGPQSGGDPQPTKSPSSHQEGESTALLAQTINPMIKGSLGPGEQLMMRYQVLAIRRHITQRIGRFRSVYHFDDKGRKFVTREVWGGGINFYTGQNRSLKLTNRVTRESVARAL